MNSLPESFRARAAQRAQAEQRWSRHHRRWAALRLAVVRSAQGAPLDSIAAELGAAVLLNPEAFRSDDARAAAALPILTKYLAGVRERLASGALPADFDRWEPDLRLELLEALNRSTEPAVPGTKEEHQP